MAGKPKSLAVPAAADEATEQAEVTSAPVADGGPTPDQVVAAEKRAASLASPDQNARMVEALLVERRGYVVRSMPDRVAQVDEQIRRYGGTPPESN